MSLALNICNLHLLVFVLLLYSITFSVSTCKINIMNMPKFGLTVFPRFFFLFLFFLTLINLTTSHYQYTHTIHQKWIDTGPDLILIIVIFTVGFLFKNFNFGFKLLNFEALPSHFNYWHHPSGLAWQKVLSGKTLRPVFTTV